MRLQIPALLILSGSICACSAPAPSVRVTQRRADVLLRPEHRTIAARVPRNATLDSLLRQHDLSMEIVSAAVSSARSVFDPRQLRADRPYKLVQSFDGVLAEFIYEIDTERFLRIFARDRSQPQALVAEVLPIEKQSAVVAVRGRIDADRSSLIAAIDDAGEHVQLAMWLADIFGGQVDFQSDLQPGDEFDVLVEKYTRDGEFMHYGAVIGARFVADGKEHRAFRWVHPETGKAAYYDQDGRSLKRFFLVSPLKFEPRVTSSFSRRRLHPVHRSYRAHLGVDYGAPHGAPVVAVAAGTVVSAGYAGGGGNQVVIRHAGGFETYYLHLAGFAKGIRRGARVDQGQLVGRVGATGTATGPHLDFRLRRNGAFVDPVKERRRQPPGEPIPSTLLTNFRQSRDGILQQLSSMRLADAPRQRPDAVKAIQ